VLRFREQYNARNQPTHPYGFARLDASGRILNEVLVHDLGVTDPAQQQAPDAPVSYPFLWDTPYFDFVQWNGVAPNKIFGSRTIGGLARNVGEVVGVFGEVVIPELGAPGATVGYDSSVRVPDLAVTEALLRKLHSPQWPAAFPPIDEALRQAGEKLFGVYCGKCHLSVDRAGRERSQKAVLTSLDEVGTDPLMALNFANRKGKTGRLQGKKTGVVIGPQFAAEASGQDILTHVVVGVILNSPFDDYQESDLLQLKRPTAAAIREVAAATLKYKARSLNGIWATAPYLHNGSVPSLYQLLLPAEERVTSFHVGRREFDPKNVGFKTEPFEGGFVFRTLDDQRNAIPGNSSAGHEYGTGADGLQPLSDTERWQLVEFMKSL
jgi:hypothetical protein